MKDITRLRWGSLGHAMSLCEEYTPPTENIETLGYACGEARTQMADVMKQMN